MRRVIHWLSACGWSLLVLPAFAADEADLIANPGFEEVDAKSCFAARWTPTYWSNPHGKVTLSDEARAGKHCVKITGVPREKITDAGKRNNNLVAQQIDLPGTGFRTFKLECWFRAAASAKAFCSVITHDSDGNRLQYISSTGRRGVDEWTQLSIPLWTPPETARLTVYLRNDGEGPAWFDDVSLKSSGDVALPPKRLPEFPAASTFFPYGEYYRGYVPDVAGGDAGHVRRQLRAYRRCYMNTYMLGESGLLSHFKQAGTVPVLEEVRKRRMRVIPRADMLRRFERDSSGHILDELPPEEPTREVILARLTQSGFTLEERRKFVKAYGDMILAYDFADEPGGQYIPNYMSLQGVYREVDPDHPVLVILNLNRTEFLPFMPIYYGDEYPIRNEKRGGRNPWAVTKMVRFCATHTKAPVWVMLQAFGGLPDYTWQLPNKAEMRLTIYEAVANGCKGLTFHGSSSPPCWRYNMYYFDTARDSWGVEAPAWEAMREAGRIITAVGPALLETEVSDEKVLDIQCETMTNDALPYRGPAIKAGVLRCRDGKGWVAVVVNQDIERPQRGTLSVNTEAMQTGKCPSTGARSDRIHAVSSGKNPMNRVTTNSSQRTGDVLYDLCDLTAIGPANSALHTIELGPGDGRIFFAGTEEDAASILAKVHKGHYNNELPLYELEAEVAVANGCDVTRAESLAKAAADACKAGEFTTAHEKIVAAREELDRTIAANEPLSRALTGLSEAQDMLSEMALTYRANFDVVMPPDLRKQTPRNAVWNNSRDPKLQGFVDQTAEAMCLRMKLEDEVYCGKAMQLLPRVVQLKQTATRLKAEAIPYVLSRATQHGRSSRHGPKESQRQ